MLYDRTCIKLNNCISPFCFMLTYLLKNNFVRISVCKYIRMSLSHSWSRLETVWKIMKEAHFHNLSMDNWHVHKTCIWIINKFLFLNYHYAAVNKKNNIVCCCLLSPMKHLIKHMFNVLRQIELWCDTVYCKTIYCRIQSEIIQSVYEPFSTHYLNNAMQS